MLTRRVLLFEDHAIVRRYLVEALTAAGYAVSDHDHVDCSPRDIVAEKWDYVILDSGALSALRQLRRAGYQGQVVVATGADLTKQDKEDIATLGGRVLFKPFNLGQLLSALETSTSSQERGDVPRPREAEGAGGKRELVSALPRF